MKKFIKWLSIVLGALVFIVLIAGVIVFRMPLPDHEIDVSGLPLNDFVEIIRDDRGVPHIYGTNVDDILFAQGYVHAQDRFWQLEFWSHLSTGRLASLIGEPGIGADLLFRTYGFNRVALKEYEEMTPEMKNDLISNITHEFKTPIATINLALDSILSNEKNKITEKTNSYLGMIREENSRMLSQVENILRISQLEKSSNPLKMEDIDLHEVIEDATEHVKLLIGSKKGKINLRLNAINRYIKGNKNHLENIIINILDNAIKYSKKSPLINFTSDTIDDKIQLCIEDRGIGMDKSTQKMIFEKFFREQNGDIHNIKGHGLGLSYVKKIVDFHNGIIKVDSEKGVGTKFSIEFKNI